MKQCLVIILFIMTTGCYLQAQVSISPNGTLPDVSAMLDVKSSNKGLLPPRMTHAEIDAITTPAPGLIVYCTDCGADGTGAFYQFVNGIWYTILTCIAPAKPVAGTHVPSATQVVWNWNPVPGATGYKWGTTAVYASALDMGTATAKTETGLACNTAYTRYVWANNACGSSSPVNFEQTTSLNSTVSLTITTSANPACSGSSVILTATPLNGGLTPVFQWRINDINIPGATNSTYSYFPTSGDAITCLLTSSAACTSANQAISNTVFMVINPNNPVSISIAASANPVCAGASVIFTATPTNAGTSPQYQWLKNNIAITAATNATYTYSPNNADAIKTILTSNATCTTGNPSTSNILTMSVNPNQAASILITPSANPVCSGTMVTFTATPTNGGISPLYQWKKNGSPITGATNNTYSYIPLNSNSITCLLTSNVSCITGSPATSNNVTMMVNPVPVAPTGGTNSASQVQIVWNWNVVSEATGYKWNTINDINTATDMGTVTTKTETGLICGISYMRFVWAYNNCGNSNATTLYTSTSACSPFPCGQSITVNHSAGAVAPVNKTVTYGTATNIPGAPTKCWITRNLGASQQASSVNDGTEASAGWYWQFNRKQGYKHDGSNRIPNSVWISAINENSNWVPLSDPCTLELAGAWHVPTSSEWNNVINAGSWTTWSGPWNSGLKIHSAGYLFSDVGSLYGRGTYGSYHSGTQSPYATLQNWFLYFFEITCSVQIETKAYGYSIRCIRD